MVGYPYYNDPVDDEGTMLSDFVVDNVTVIIFTSVLVAVCGVNPALAVDNIVNGTATSKTRSAAALAVLGTIDGLACGKSYECFEQLKTHLVGKATEKPEVTVAVICTAAMVWCARGVAERIVNQHL